MTKEELESKRYQLMYDRNKTLRHVANIWVVVPVLIPVAVVVGFCLAAWLNR